MIKLQKLRAELIDLQIRSGCCLVATVCQWSRSCTFAASAARIRWVRWTTSTLQAFFFFPAMDLPGLCNVVTCRQPVFAHWVFRPTFRTILLKTSWMQRHIASGSVQLRERNRRWLYFRCALNRTLIYCLWGWSGVVTCMSPVEVFVRFLIGKSVPDRLIVSFWSLVSRSQAARVWLPGIKRSWSVDFNWSKIILQPCVLDSWFLWFKGYLDQL